MKYLYGDAWERFLIGSGQVWSLPNGSRVAVHDIFDPLPAWMRADLVFVDPPWNQGNLNCFYTKAERSDYQDFGYFADTLFRRIAEIGARTAYIEIGNQAMEEWRFRLQRSYPSVQCWPVTYYRKFPTNLLRVGSTPIDYDFTGIDEARCIQILAEIEQYRVLADPCMGRGLAGIAAYKTGHVFMGTELNKRRLAVLIDRLDRAGAQWMIKEET